MDQVVQLGDDQLPPPAFGAVGRPGGSASDMLKVECMVVSCKHMVFRTAGKFLGAD